MAASRRPNARTSKSWPAKRVVSPPAKTPRVVVAAGGALDTAMLPLRLLHLRADYRISLAAAVSRGALDFVTPTALTAVTGAPVYDPDARFAPGSSVPVHLELADADLLVVYPATARIVAQCALGEVTCPVTRVFAFTPKDRIVIAPAIHTRKDRPLYVDHAARLRAVGCTLLGGDALWATWAEVEETIVRRLSLSRTFRSGDVLLDQLVTESASR